MFLDRLGIESVALSMTLLITVQKLQFWTKILVTEETDLMKVISLSYEIST